jgi:hypothetical protein
VKAKLARLVQISLAATALMIGSCSELGEAMVSKPERALLDGFFADARADDVDGMLSAISLDRCGFPEVERCRRIARLIVNEVVRKSRQGAEFKLSQATIVTPSIANGNAQQKRFTRIVYDISSTPGLKLLLWTERDEAPLIVHMGFADYR